ncbi:Receptor-like cytosolic serine/threonine-protein kinase [Arachis hypogaea]|nr:Receptor-like cytosolic serine/threonine-protein kinase [Arachis hypogaea]
MLPLSKVRQGSEVGGGDSREQEGLIELCGNEEKDIRIIHKDIKVSNILLFETFEPQTSDFGLAKWLPDQWTHHTVSKVEGTFRYLSPKFFMHGIVDEKTDVYAYGVLLLELITGRQALDISQKFFIMWAGYATLAIGTEWIFRPKQEVISPVLCSCDALLLLLTGTSSSLMLILLRSTLYISS